MKLLSLLAALALIHYQPLRKTDWLRQVCLPYAQWLEHHFNGGKQQHGIIAWLIGVLVPVLLIGISYYLLLEVNRLFGLILAIAILYLTLEFSHFGRDSESIASALRDNDIDQARELFAGWQQTETGTLNATEIARKSIEHTLQQSHYGLFAPIFWFVVLGPAGAVLYRLAHTFRLEWHPLSDTPFNRFALSIFNWLDWLPAQVTAGCFAIVGDFEDAVYCWRTQAATWTDKALGIILASGAGALGVRLGEPVHEGLQFHPELGLGDDADADYIKSAIGLVWRVLVLMTGLLLLLTFATWLGG